MREKVGEFKNQFRELKEENCGLKEQLRRLQEEKNVIMETQEHLSKKSRKWPGTKRQWNFKRQNGENFAKYRQRAKAVVEDRRWKINCHWHMHEWAAASIRKYKNLFRKCH